MLDVDETMPEILEGLMEFELSRNEWDAIPMVFAVLNPGPEEPEKFRLSMFMLDPDFWTKAPPAIMMMVMGEAIGIAGSPNPPLEIEVGDEVLGVITFTEGWGVSGERNLPEDDLKDWLAAGKGLSEHPLAVEVKMFTGITANGSYSVNHARGDKESSTATAMEGRVPDAMRKIFESLRLRYSMPTD